MHGVYLAKMNLNSLQSYQTLDFLKIIQECHVLAQLKVLVQKFFKVQTWLLLKTWHYRISNGKPNCPYFFRPQVPIKQGSNLATNLFTSFNSFLDYQLQKKYLCDILPNCIQDLS